MSTRGLKTTAASRILERFVPPYNATVVAAARGRRRDRSSARRISTNSRWARRPRTRPSGRRAIPGRSIARPADRAAARRWPSPRGWRRSRLGSDTGGSIRQPAALCGVVGLKPTYGRVSRYGLLAFASSLDQIGPLARTVHDAALVLEVIAGADPHDSTAAPEPVPDYRDALTGDVRGLRIGVPARGAGRWCGRSGADAPSTPPSTCCKRSGARLVDIDLPHARYAIPIYYLIATAEASSNLARYDGVRYGLRAALDKDGTLQAMYDRTRDEGFGAEVKRRIMLGTYVLSAGYYDAYYLKAQQVRTLLRRDYEQAFERVDVIAMPTTPDAGLQARREDRRSAADVSRRRLHGERQPGGAAGDQRAVRILRASACRSDCSSPAARSTKRTLLRAADAYQRDTDWHHTRRLRFRARRARYGQCAEALHALRSACSTGLPADLLPALPSRDSRPSKAEPEAGPSWLLGGDAWSCRRAARTSGSCRWRSSAARPTSVKLCGTLKCARLLAAERAQLVRLGASAPALSTTNACGASPHFSSRQADDRGLLHRRVAQQHRLDFDRRDVLAAADDHVLEAVANLDVAVGMDDRGVAGVEPAVAHHRRGGLGIVVVAVHHDVAARRRSRPSVCAVVRAPRRRRRRPRAARPTVISSTPCRALMPRARPAPTSAACSGRGSQTVMNGAVSVRP